MPVLNPAHIDSVLNQLTGQQFTTLDFIDLFRIHYPEDWTSLEARYGSGGEGCGRHYSANSYIALRLNDRLTRNELVLADYVSAPTGWGNPVIARWQKD